ncbi:MAG: hypothetical protein CVU11_10835 [Bacteroidetes bacterium HGW-Bacteroidetes-6]|nr:MAG: hypothetical protein CVU11_10835 [Bacteroidetes bacterium HGW-Bacteroidetes-6]
MLYKYIFGPLWVGGMLFGVFMGLISEEPNSFHFMLVSLPIIGLFSFLFLMLSFRLRRVEASKKQIIIKSLRGKKTINYQDIEWISQPAMIRPVLISINYFDRENEQSVKILIMPDTLSQLFSFSLFEEHEMTTFLRENILIHNPAYSKTNEPSRWIPILQIAAVATASMLLMKLLLP